MSEKVEAEEPQVSAAIEQEDETEKATPPTWLERAISFYWVNEFLILAVVAILLAKAYPPLGADYLQPQITSKWIAVIFIFVMAGLGLKTEEFVNAFRRVYFNAFIQVFNFGVISSVVFGFSRLMIEVGAINKDLADGMVICGCLPLTVNMCVVLTKSAGGDEAAAIFNTAFSNMIGIFISPLLILAYIGVSGDIAIGTTFYELSIRVILPIIVGQFLRQTSKTVVDFVTKYKSYFSQAQQYALVFIIYTTFCKTFSEERESNIGDIFLMILFQLFLLCTFMVLSWVLLRLLFPDEPQLRVMGLFGCTHKTVAVGVPLINAIYEGNPNVGLYTLPLLIWHPMQLMIGTALSPRLKAFVEAERERLGIVDEEDGKPDDVQQLGFAEGELVVDEEQ